MKISRRADQIKTQGIHYTPPVLADFLATSVVRHLPKNTEKLQVLDPACGDGALLQALATKLMRGVRRQLVVTGYDMDATALAVAGRSLESCEIGDVILRAQDFLAEVSDSDSLWPSSEGTTTHYDCVIANPPYVRTQVLGAKTSQRLARRFGLTGRVDLYQAFTLAMASVLRTGGVLGLLTSNRFLTTNAGERLRRFFRAEFQIRELYDLGDTKLFSAAVLPAILVAVKGRSSKRERPNFTRVYETRRARPTTVVFPHILDAVQNFNVQGVVETPQGVFFLEKGTLAPSDDLGGKWSLSTPEYDAWLERVRQNQSATFEDIASIRVGIKTTADEVFVRSNWCRQVNCPEGELLRPLITHRMANRWRLSPNGTELRVLYPYDVSLPGKQPVALEMYPKAQQYLLGHKERLMRREYVLAAGREWYEIWVPQVPSKWAMPKIVFPDIAESPKFSLDRTGAIVQGDCYWMTLKNGVDPALLYVMLAVANSRFGTKYYDLMFHNKLYAGRRRYMTQYVNKYPLPRLDARLRRELCRVVEALTSGSGTPSALEAECDELVWKSFGLAEEIGR